MNADPGIKSAGTQWIGRGLLMAALVFGPLTAGETAWATDGLIELNQARALAGISEGDAPGFPLALYQSGSYVLTSNLVLPNQNTDGIVVHADDVSIDLNGFTIQGPTTCLPQVADGKTSAVSCTNVGPGRGIYAITRTGLLVRNGTLHGLGANGIEATSCDAVRLEDLVVRDCGGAGVQAPGALVRRLTAQENGGAGIHGARIVVDSVARSNGGDGVHQASRVERVISDLNVGSGIHSGGSAILLHNITRNNGSYGIYCGGGLVLENVTTANTLQGLWLNVATGHRNNVLTGDGAGGLHADDAIELGPNVCNGSAQCP